MILRKTAKKFDGINPEALREYHKSHILDTMGIVVVGVDFEDSLDNGGAIKLFFLDIKVPKLDREILLIIMVLLLKIKKTPISLIVM